MRTCAGNCTGIDPRTLGGSAASLLPLSFSLRLLRRPSLSSVSHFIPYRRCCPPNRLSRLLTTRPSSPLPKPAMAFARRSRKLAFTRVFRGHLLRRSGKFFLDAFCDQPFRGPVGGILLRLLVNSFGKNREFSGFGIVFPR